MNASMSFSIHKAKLGDIAAKKRKEGLTALMVKRISMFYFAAIIHQYYT